MMKNKILVVDDEDYHRELMQKLLSKLGYEVEAVESAEDAFSFVTIQYNSAKKVNKVVKST